MPQRRMQPIALVIFDAFDTLVTPRIAPYLQYAEEARKVGLDIDDERLKAAFKASFKRLAKAHPTYGLRTGLRTADEWWLMLIEDSMLSSGVASAKLNPVLQTLGSALLRRFGSAEAYQLAEGVPGVLEQLSRLHGEQSDEKTSGALRTHVPTQFAMSLATNSDARILNACKDLHLDRYLDVSVQYDPTRPPTQVDSCNATRKAWSGPTLSYDVGFEKPDARFFHAAVQRAFPHNQVSPSTLSTQQMCQRTLYVGDHYEEDYVGATQAGLQAVWLQRSQLRPAVASHDEQIQAVSSMLDVIHIVRESWT